MDQLDIKSNSGTMDNKQIMAIVAVIVVVIAVAAAYFVLSGNNNDNKSEPYDISDIDLAVYGNANGDNTIDQKDIDLINEIIDNGYSIDSYPLADANKDGTIDSKDVDKVRDIIAGNQTDVTLIDQYNETVTVSYPLKNLVVIGSDMIQMMIPFNGTDYVAGYVCSDSYPVVQKKLIDNTDALRLCGGRQLTADGWQALTQLDSTLQSEGKEIGAIIIINDEALTDYVDDVKASGIPTIHIRCTDPYLSLSGSILLGYLLGEETEKISQEYVTDCRELLNLIDERVGDLSDSEKATFISMTMIYYVAENDSQYTYIGEAAGGLNVSGLEGDGSSKLQDTEAITQYNGKLDAILNITTKDCVNIDPSTLWENKNIDKIQNSDAFEDMVFINASMPTTIRVMYAAAVLYPEYFTVGEVDAAFQEIVDKYMSYLDETVDDSDFDVSKDMMTIITYQDYLDSKA